MAKKSLSKIGQLFNAKYIINVFERRLNLPIGLNVIKKKCNCYNRAITFLEKQDSMLTSQLMDINFICSE